MSQTSLALFKWLFYVFLFSIVSGLPLKSETDNEINKLFQETKRDTSGASGGGPLLKSVIFNPYANPYLYPPLFPPGKAVLPALTPADIFLNRFAKASSDSPDADADTTPLPLLPISSYFKAKKDAFLAKLFEKIATATDSPDISARSLPPPIEEDSSTEAPTTPSPPPKIDPSFFLNKKFDFLAKLFKTINSTATTTASPLDDSTGTDSGSTTVKPTIVPADFWFPFPKVAKPTKAPKAPKPTKPPKAKNVLKDALDTILLQSLLTDLGVDGSTVAGAAKRDATVAMAKKSKAKKTKPVETGDLIVPAKIDPALYSSTVSGTLDKLFKTLNKSGEVEGDIFIAPKAQVIPSNLWSSPSETEYTSKVDAFLDLLEKSVNEIGISPAESPKKPFKFAPKKLVKRSTFLDEFLHRIPPSTTAATPTTTEAALKKDCDGSCETPGNDLSVKDPKSRSLIFKPFGTGYWIPQYLYAAKMGLYLDKLIDTIDSQAAEDFAGTPTLKRSVVDPSSAPGEVPPNLSPKEAALNLIIAELTELKNDLVETFSDGVKAATTTTAKPFGPPGKSFKKPFWGAKTTPAPDPVAEVKKRIDLINDVFDKLTTVEKTLLFSQDIEDPKLWKNITMQILQSSAKPVLINEASTKPIDVSTPASPKVSPQLKEALKTLLASGKFLNDSEER